MIGLLFTMSVLRWSYPVDTSKHIPPILLGSTDNLMSVGGTPFDFNVICLILYSFLGISHVYILHLSSLRFLNFLQLSKSLTFSYIHFQIDPKVAFPRRAQPKVSLGSSVSGLQ